MVIGYVLYCGNLNKLKSNQIAAHYLIFCKLNDELELHHLFYTFGKYIDLFLKLFFLFLSICRN
jgi:hypothetical protein